MNDHPQIRRRRARPSLLVATAALIAVAAASLGAWTMQGSGVKARLRGVSAASPRVAWATGNNGTCLRTVDAGATWKALAPPDAAGLDFRDVHAVDADNAYVLAIGPGELSKVFKTADAGASWSVSHQNRDPKGFLDAIAFWDLEHGLALGDPVEGRYVILSTDDAGKSWAPTPAAGMPPALPGEGAFAASGTCLVTWGRSHAWFGTGGGESSRVFRSTDRGRTWSASTLPIRAGNASSGVFSLAFLDANVGVAVGGDYKRPDDAEGNCALTLDGGKTWTAVAKDNPRGFRSAVAYLPGTEGPALVAVGPSGSDLSRDGGRTWTPLGPEGFHAFSVAPGGGAGWGVGEDGRIGKFSIER